MKRNTAISDLKLGSHILNEAASRGLIERNPWTRLGFEREEQGIKPELTDEEISACLKALGSKEWPEWMRVSFTIALHTGLRFSETAIPMRNVDFVEKTILIESPKGGRKRAYSIPIPDALMPLLQELRRSKARTTWTIPSQEKSNRFTALDWRRFFDSLEFQHLSFHCLRVTFISRGCRAGIPENAMCRLVNHASKEIDRIYQRISVADVRQYANRIQFPKTFGSATD